MKHTNACTKLLSRLAADTSAGKQSLMLGLHRSANGSPGIRDGADDLVKVVNDLVRKAALRLGSPFSWSTLQLEFGSIVDWQGGSEIHPKLAFGLGDYEGGEVELRGFPPYDLHGRALIFDGTVPYKCHSSDGPRCLVVAMLSDALGEVSLPVFEQLDGLGFELAGSVQDHTYVRLVALDPSLQAPRRPLSMGCPRGIATVSAASQAFPASSAASPGPPWFVPAASPLASAASLHPLASPRLPRRPRCPRQRGVHVSAGRNQRRR